MFQSLFMITLVFPLAINFTWGANHVVLTCASQSNESERGPPGPPGKRGPQGSLGPPGPAGAKGEPDRTDISRQELDTLKNQVNKLHEARILKEAGSCRDLQRLGQNKSGLYQIYVERLAERFSLYCDQETDGGGWLVIQRRSDGSEDFYRTWNEYRRGFGNKSNEFWLGLDLLHELTAFESHELRVDVEDFENLTAYAKYRSFQVGPLSSSFRLEVNGYSGTAGDAMTYHSGRQFSTKDRDNDEYSKSCAQEHHGAWWYKRCHFSNLNGKYLVQQGVPRGVSWYQWKGRHYSLKRAEMKIRPL